MGAAAGATGAARVVRPSGVAAVSCQAATATTEVRPYADWSNSRRTVATITAESATAAAGNRRVVEDGRTASPAHDVIVLEHHPLQRNIRVLIDE